MWVTRKISTLNISRRFYTTASTYTYTLVKRSNRVNSLFVFKPYLFRGNFLWKDEVFKTSSRRFSCKENYNKELLNTGKESEGDDCVTSEKVNDFDIEQIDRLIYRLENYVDKTSYSWAETINQEHLDYLSKIAGDNKNTLNYLLISYYVLRKLSEAYSIQFRMECYDWMSLRNKNEHKLYQAIRRMVYQNIRKKKEYSRSLGELIDIDMSHEFDPYCYHLYHNSHFLRVHKSAVNRRERSRGVLSMLYSPVILYDCSYEKYMREQEVESVAWQISAAILNNLRSKLPLHIILCNFNESLHLHKALEKYVPYIHDGTVPITMTDKSYLDLYPRNDLVYLSPHANEMTEWDPNKIYIAGAFVDKYQQMPISIYKAREGGITCRKFPIDSYVKWERGSKNFGLNVVHNVVNEMFISNDWNKAFQLLPEWCVRKPRNSTSEERIVFDDVVKSFYNEGRFMYIHMEREVNK